MYLAPLKGFKPSICNNPANPFHYSNMADIAHGVVSYDLNAGKACYRPASGEAKFMIQLIPGKDDTMESWFKIGGADVMAAMPAAKAKACSAAIRQVINAATRNTPSRPTTTTAGLSADMRWSRFSTR